MSLKIYTDVVVVPARFLALVKLLLQEGALPREKILGMLQPREDQAMAASVLLAAGELGVVKDTAAGYDLTPEVRLKLGQERHVAEKLPALMAPLLLAAKVGGKPNGFAQICAWFLLHDYADLQVKKHELLVLLERDGLSLDELQARNMAVWDNIVYWARYIGLIYQHGAALAGNVVPDPTRFIELHLDELFQTDKRLTSDEWFDRLGRICPVLDGGEVRRAQAEKMSLQLARQALSNGLSIALLRLERRGVLKLEGVEDAETFHLLTEERRLTHVVRCA